MKSSVGRIRLAYRLWLVLVLSNHSSAYCILAIMAVTIMELRDPSNTHRTRKERSRFRHLGEMNWMDFLSKSTKRCLSNLQLLLI